ncbi:MAG: hypothetical protein AB7F19_07670 [Candidatus Babeliales bacterium]
MIDWIMTHLNDIITWATAVVTGASALAAATPTPKDDSALASIKKVINWFALNVANAKPAKPTNE